jgi:hypothetical protein
MHPQQGMAALFPPNARLTGRLWHLAESATAQQPLTDPSTGHETTDRLGKLEAVPVIGRVTCWLTNLPWPLNSDVVLRAKGELRNTHLWSFTRLAFRGRFIACYGSFIAKR